MRAVAATVSIRKLFAVFIALAVLFAPAVSRASAAFAGMPDHELMMEQIGHCQMPAGSADHEKGAGKTCCISMCMAVTINGSVSSDHDVVEHVSPISSIRTLHLGYLGEIATPPPRRA